MTHPLDRLFERLADDIGVIDDQHAGHGLFLRRTPVLRGTCRGNP
jgi:hypothetical protein